MHVLNRIKLSDILSFSSDVLYLPVISLKLIFGPMKPPLFSTFVNNMTLCPYREGESNHAY